MRNRKQTPNKPGAKDGGRGPVAARTGAGRREPADWRGETLSRIRALIRRADPDAVEEVKWRKPSNPAGVVVWSHGGVICTGETYREHVKLTFARGASLKDPARLFNQVGAVRCAIDIRRGESLDEGAFQDLIRSAVALNTAGRGR
jgi:hypothetical protein